MRWDAEAYDARHHYVADLGAPVVELLAPRPGERVLDLGCGTGRLTHAIAERGAGVVGLDRSAEMIAEARRTYPDLTFVMGDAAAMTFEAEFDAVFSNAALHWIPPEQQPAVAAGIARALGPGGRFMAEFGGQGNIACTVAGLRAASQAFGRADALPRWHFPSIAAQAALLETAGLEVVYAALFDRPTRVEEADGGLEGWIEMFAPTLLAGLPTADRARLITAATERLRPQLFRDGAWWMDYRRLRMAALKV